MAKTMTMSLLEKAKARTSRQVYRFSPARQDVELSLAWARGDVTLGQAASAWGCTRKAGGHAIPSSTYRRLAESLRAHILAEKA